MSYTSGTVLVESGEDDEMVVLRECEERAGEKHVPGEYDINTLEPITVSEYTGCDPNERVYEVVYIQTMRNWELETLEQVRQNDRVKTYFFPISKLEDTEQTFEKEYRGNLISD